MKLISELVEEPLKLIVEEDENKEKKYFIEGIYMQANLANKNRRFYPLEILEREVARYTKQLIEKNRAYGELGHPNGPSINLERVCHLVQSLKKEDNNFIGRSKVLNTPYGDIVSNLLKEGACLGVSSRGMGSLKPKGGINYVQEDYHLAAAADVVADPSGPNCFVQGILEGVEWVFNENYGWKAIEIVESQKKILNKNRNYKKITNEGKARLFENFLNSLR